MLNKLSIDSIAANNANNNVNNTSENCPTENNINSHKTHQTSGDFYKLNMNSNTNMNMNMDNNQPLSHRTKYVPKLNKNKYPFINKNFGLDDSANSNMKEFDSQPKM